jgi:hypothetical protein
MEGINGERVVGSGDATTFGSAAPGSQGTMGIIGEGAIGGKL